MCLVYIDFVTNRLGVLQNCADFVIWLRVIVSTATIVVHFKVSREDERMTKFQNKYTLNAPMIESSNESK